MRTATEPDRSAVLDAAEAVVVELRRAEFARLRLARDWALANPGPPPEVVRRNPFCARAIGSTQLVVEAHVEAELAACLQLHPLAALRLMADAVDLEARLPAAWSAVASCRLEVWVARKLVAATASLDDDKARWVDAQVSDLLGTMPAGRLLRIVEARVVEADQDLAERLADVRAARRGVWLGRASGSDGATNRDLFARGESEGMRQLGATVDHLAGLLRDHSPELVEDSMDALRARALLLLANPLAALKLLIGSEGHAVPDAVAEAIREASAEKCRPRATCYVHLSPEMLDGGGVARAEEIGVLTRQQLLDLLGHHHVTLKPVIDLNDDVAADCYEVPAAISERLRLIRPTDCFPFAPAVDLKGDQDHTVPYRPHGPPGQTRISNLGRMTRRHHRIKTFAGWRVWQQEGRFFWLTPHGRIYITDARGTHQLTADVGTFADAARARLDDYLALAA